MSDELISGLISRFGAAIVNDDGSRDWPCPVCDNHPASTLHVSAGGAYAACSACGSTTRALLAALRSGLKARDRIVSVRAADVKPANVRWAWRGWLPLGMYSTLVGMPGFGKTTLATYIAARFTQGELDGDLAGQPATVLFISYEDWSTFGCDRSQKLMAPTSTGWSSSRRRPLAMSSTSRANWRRSRQRSSSTALGCSSSTRWWRDCRTARWTHIGIRACGVFSRR